MAVSSRENVALWVVFLPLGIAVNAVFLWGARDIINLKDPLFWMFGIAFHVWLYKIGKRG